MKIHDENCSHCCKTEGEEECFDSFKEMMDYHQTQKKWYKRAWDFVYYPCYRLFDKIRYFPKEVKWFYQRGSRGWSDSDAWSVYDHLINIIPPMLKQIKDNKYGFPMSMYDASNKTEFTDEEQKIAIEKWDTILDTIIEAFEIEKGISDGNILDLGNKPTKEQKEWSKKHCKEFDLTLLTAKQKRIRKLGWKYFQQYFHNLWD